MLRNLVLEVILLFDVIVLDLDGTLLKSDKTVSEKTIEALKKCENLGKKIVIATARPPRFGKLALPEDLRNEMKIFYNGAEIYCGENRIYSKNIPVESLRKILNILRNKRVSLEINDILYSNFDVTGIFGNIRYERTDFEYFELKPAAKVLVDLTCMDNIEDISCDLPTDCDMVVTDNGTLCQIMARDVSKLNALKIILNQLGTTLDRVAFFGDDFNDIDLIKECGVGIAMGNAVPKLKEIANYVTKSNDEDGIAFFLNSYINGSIA